jgi:Trypsin-like peptidase domain
MRAQRSVNDTIAWLRAANDPNAVAGAACLISPHLALTCAQVVRDHLGLSKPTPYQLPTDTVHLSFQGLGADIESKVAPSGWWPEGGEDAVVDVAVLELVQPLEGIKFAGLATSQPSPGMDCDVYGAVGGYQSIGQTVYAQITSRPNASGWRQLDARPGRESGYFVRRGFSGSPVLDPWGNTIWGMVAAVETEPGKLIAFAIPAEDLWAATQRVRSAHPVPLRSEHDARPDNRDPTTGKPVQSASSPSPAERRLKHPDFLRKLYQMREYFSEDTRNYIEKRVIEDWYESEISK